MKNNTELSAAFRTLADVLEANPGMAHPYQGTAPAITFYSHKRDEFLATVRAFGNDGKRTEDSNTFLFRPTDFPLPIDVVGFKEGIAVKTETVVTWTDPEFAAEFPIGKE